MLRGWRTASPWPHSPTSSPGRLVDEAETPLGCFDHPDRDGVRRSHHHRRLRRHRTRLRPRHRSTSTVVARQDRDNLERRGRTRSRSSTPGSEALMLTSSTSTRPILTCSPTARAPPWTPTPARSTTHDVPGAGWLRRPPARAIGANAAGVLVRVVGLDDLIRMKVHPVAPGPPRHRQPAHRLTTTNRRMVDVRDAGRCASPPR